MEMTLTQMSFAGGVMVLAILALRALALHRLPKRLFLLLWEAALLRLLIPFSIPSPLSAYTLVDRSPLGDTAPVQALQRQAVALVPQGEQAVIGGTVSAPGNPLPLWPLVWGVGAALLGLCFLLAYLRCYREFRTSLPVEDGWAAQWLQAHPLRRTIRLRQSDRLSTPLTYGVFRPVILLPKALDWQNREELDYILLHEYIHIRRLDALRKLALTLALCLHWFNPLVWVMYLCFNQDIELACDEQVVRRSGIQSRRAYASTLVHLEERRSWPLPLYNHFSQNVVRERILAIMKTRKITLGITLLCVVILSVIVILFATSGVGSSDAPAGDPPAAQEDASGGETDAANQEDLTEEPDSSSVSQMGDAQLEGSVEVSPEEGSEADVPRPATTILTCLMEGEEEEMPATLYVGDGFSLYIPDEGWTVYDQSPVPPERMSAVLSPEVGLWIEYHERPRSEVSADLRDQGYTANEEVLQLQAGETLNEVWLFADGEATWAFCSRRPATSEGTEGAAVRLEAIRNTLALPGDSGLTGAESEPETETQAALGAAMTGFYTAYFSGDTDAMEPYLSAAYEGDPQGYDFPETAGEIEYREIRGMSAAASEDTQDAVLSLEFVVPGEDSFTYLTVHFQQEDGAWKVTSYGLEK